MRRLALTLAGLLTAVGISLGQPITGISQTCVSSATMICIVGNDDASQQQANDRNRTYEGVVGESAGAEARLLFDYPQTQRDAILDMLFCNPNVVAATGYCTNSYYAASLSALKVEIGGDSNSTQGSEASFARTSTEFNALHQDFDVSGTEAQQQADCHLTRGYEWWLMREATRRNPQIPILALVWNAPNYLKRTVTPYADNSFYSDQTQSNGNSIDYYRFFIRCAAVNKIYDNGTGGDDPALSNGTKVTWVGAWNETDYRDWTNPTPTWTHTDWVNSLGQMAHSQNPTVKAVCCDLTMSWDPASSDLQNSVFGTNVDAVSAHDETFLGTAAPSSLQTYTGGAANPDGIWEGEDCFCLADENPQPQNDWTFAGLFAKWINRNYIESRASLTSLVPLISSYYEYLYAPSAGITTVDTPWSGNYQVWEAIWAVAHTTQYAIPGQWSYVNMASCFLGQVQGTNCRTPMNNGSYVTFKGPGTTKDWATVVETIDGTSTRSLTLCPTTSNLKAPSSIWYVVSNSSGQFIGSSSQYISKDANGCYPFGNNLAPASVYTFSTLGTAYKGTFSPSCVQSSCTFPYHYLEDFDEPTPGDSSTTTQCPRAVHYLNSAYAMNATPCWISNQEGSFEITPNCGAPNGGNCVEQTLAATPIPTCGSTTPNPPCTPPGSDLYWAVVGDPTALPSNYHWRVQFKILDSGGSIDLFGHVNKSTYWEGAPNSYRLELSANGAWALYKGSCNTQYCSSPTWSVLSNETGTLSCFHPGGSCDSTVWNMLDMSFTTGGVAGDTINVTLTDRNCTNHIFVLGVRDSSGPYTTGAVGLGSTTSRVAFDQLEIADSSHLLTCSPY